MRVQVDRAAVQELLYSPNGPVFQEVERYSRLVANRAKQIVGVDTGRLRSSIQHVVRVEGTRVVGRIGTVLEYGLYHHQGTGIHGPKRRPIRPVRAKMLVFEVRGTGTVFAQEVQGSKANPFLVRALQEMVPWQVTQLSGGGSTGR